MKATMKNLNEITQKYRFSFYKGAGYFYFEYLDDDYDRDLPESIYVYALNHCSYEWWVQVILIHIKQAGNEILPEHEEYEI